MLLTRVQANILDLLCKLKYMKISQINWFLYHGFELKKEQSQKQIAQLQYLNKLQVESGFIFLPDCNCDDEMIVAVDIMREFCDKDVPYFSVGIPPCKLVFFTPTESEKVNVFKLFFVALGQELLTSTEAQRQNQPPDHTVLFFVQDKAQIPLLQAAKNTYYILKNGKGGYEFYR